MCSALRGLLPWHFHPLEGLVGLDDPLHLGLDGRQILVGDRAGGPHVVVKALAHRGAEGEFHPLEEPHHGPGHDVGRGMPHDGERPGIAGVEGLEIDRAVRRQRGIEPDGRAVEHRRDRTAAALGAGCAGRSSAEDVGDAGGRLTRADGAVGEANVEHGAEGRCKKVFRAKRERIRPVERATSGEGGFPPLAPRRLTRPSLGARLLSARCRVHLVPSRAISSVG